MIGVAEFLEKQRTAAKSPPPIDELVGTELDTLCANARLVAQVCDQLGFEFRGFPHLMGMLEGARARGVDLVDLVEDPDDRPYIWDLED